MNKLIEEFKVTLTYQTIVDTESGEITTECTSKKLVKTRKQPAGNSDAETIPRLNLYDIRFFMNRVAMKLLGVKQGDRVEIKYCENAPVIGNAKIFGPHKVGNLIGKNGVVSYRGKKNSELAKYGTDFVLTPYTTEGLFVLKSEVTKKDGSEDENIKADANDFDLSLDGLSTDNNTTEITDDFFNLL